MFDAGLNSSFVNNISRTQLKYTINSLKTSMKHLNPRLDVYAL